MRLFAKRESASAAALSDDVAAVPSADARPSSPSVAALDFRALYDENVAFVWRNLRRLGVHDGELEDRTQEVFIVAFRRAGTFEDRGFGARAWLYQILLRVASESRRHRRRHPEDATELDAEPAPDAGDPAHLLERRRDVEMLDRALRTIDVARRAVLVLHEIEEMSAPEIAVILEIPTNTVYSRLRVARAELELALRTAAAAAERAESAGNAAKPLEGA